MKIFILFILMLNLNATDLKERIEKLSVLAPKTDIVYANYDPFEKGKKVVLKTIEAKAPTKVLHVTTILNNKAFIESKWYKVGDSVKGYKIVQITANSVLTKKSGKIVKLGIKKSEKLLKIRDKKQ